MLIRIHVNRWDQQKHVQWINNLKIHNRPVFKRLSVIVNNPLLWQLTEITTFVKVLSFLCVLKNPIINNIILSNYKTELTSMSLK